MRLRDCTPLANTPVSQQIRSIADNRLGAVYSALYSFWSARSNAFAAAGVSRRDAYSMILFNQHATSAFTNDMTLSPVEMLSIALSYGSEFGTNFDMALELAEVTLEAHWNPERFILFQTMLTSHELRPTDIQLSSSYLMASVR
jgi:hypothetical protein